MGLREKVTLSLVIIALIQIACRHCMPRTPRKASLKRYLNDLKPVKNNPVSTPYLPSRVNKIPKRTFGKTVQNGRITQNSLPKKSLYKTYNFPENEYPLDNSPRDPFRIGMNFNDNNHVNTLHKSHNLQSSAINDFKKEMKMKRKLLSNKQVNNENRQLKTDMYSIKFAQSPDSIRFLDSETFPEVQYPLNTMDTWGPNYWNYLSFKQEEPFHRFRQQTLKPKAKEDVNQPFTRLTKAKASKYLQSYDKLKEEHKRTSTENSKRSNVGQTGLNFTKTATCETVSDDFIAAGLVSNIPSNSTEVKKALTSSTEITASSENTCPVTEYPHHPVPIPYKVIENNSENGQVLKLKYNTEELADVDNSVIAQTLQLIQEILFNDDTSSAVSPGNFSKELEKNMNNSDCSDVPENKDIPITLVDCGKNITITPSKESSQEVSDEMAPVGILQNNLPSAAEETISENIPTVAGPLNVRMPLPFSENHHEIQALTNTTKPGITNMAPISNGFAVPSSTSTIIIPMNINAAGKSKSHMFETRSDTPIIVYLPSTQTPPFNQTVSSSLDYTVPNNQLYNILSNMALLQNDKPFSTALVSELLNSNSDSGSSLPILETLPTNSMCYNNESSPSSMREKPISDILLHKSLTDVAAFVTTTRDDKMSKQPIETVDLDVNTNTLPPITDFEHPLFDFSGSEFPSLSHGPYNNVLNTELPIIAREIDSNQQTLNVSSNDLFISTQNLTSEHLHNTTSVDSVSEDSLSELPNYVSPAALVKNFSSVTPTDSIDELKTKPFLPESISNLQEPVDTLSKSLAQPINKILVSTTLIEPPSAELPQPKDSSLSPGAPLSETLSDKLPEIMDAKVSTTPVLDTTTYNEEQSIDKTSLPSPILNSATMMTDMTLKTELYKIRQILDKMLSTDTTTYSQPPPTYTTLLPISDSDSLLLLMNETPTGSIPVPAVNKTFLLLPATDSPIDSLRQVHETLPPISVDATPTDILPLPENKLVIPNKLIQTDIPSLPINETVLPTLVYETSADNKPYLLDNLVTPLSETVTSRTKDTPDSGLLHKMDDLPLKMDLKFPDTNDISRDDLLASVDDLPTKVYPEDTTDPGVSTNGLPTQVVETLIPLSEVPVSDQPKPTHVLSLPPGEVLEHASPVVPTGSVKTLMSGFTEKLLQDFPSSKVPSDGLPTLPMNVFKLPIRETFPEGQFNEISSEGPPQNYRLPLSVPKLIPDLSLSNAFNNEPYLKDDSPSLVIDKNIEIPQSSVDTKDLSLVLEHLLSPENDVTPDSVVTDIPSAVSPSLNKRLQTTNLDQTSDEVLSVSTIPDIPRDMLTFPVHKMSPLADDTPTDIPLLIYKTPTNSKLPTTKALLENVLSDINKGGLSSVAKALPVTPHALLDKTLHYVDVKSPLSETKNIPLWPVEKIFPHSQHTDDLIDNIPFSEKPVDSSIADLHSELLLPMDEMYKDRPYIIIPTDNLENHNKNETQYFFNPTHDLPVPIETVSPTNTTKTPSSSKLPITRTLLENVLSDITTKAFSVPVAQPLPVTSPSVLDKTLYHVESPISQITEYSPALRVDKTVTITSLSDHSTDNLPISIEANLSLPIDKTLLESQSLDIPKELSPIDNLGLDIPNISMYDTEQDESANPSSENLTDDLSSAAPLEGILSLSKDTPRDLKNPDNKTPSSSKLPIAKALLVNVLSDITTKSFSVPVAQSLPVISPSVLDKTLYQVESPISQITEDIPALPVDKTLPTTSLSDHSTDNLPITIEDNLSLPIDKTFSESQSLDIPTELSSPNDKLGLDKPNISMCDKEQDESANPSSENLTHDLSSASLMEGIFSLSKDTLSDLKNPNNKTPSPSKLPIAKAFLENVLSDITTKGFSLPVAQSFPVTSPSMLDKTLYQVESPISQITEDSPALPVDKNLPITSLSDYSTDNLSISIEDNLSLPIDKTFSESQSLDIPTELSPIDNLGLDIPNFSMYGKEQNESANPSSENLTDYLSSASPPKGILSLSKDTPSDLKKPDNKTPSSSKLPIAKALLVNVLSDITTKSFSVPVAQSLPVTSPSVLDKTLYQVESPISQITEDIPALPVDKTLPITSLSDHSTDNLPISIEDNLSLPIDKTFSESQSLDIPTELSSPNDKLGLDKPSISMYDKEQDESANPSLENLTDDLSSAAPLEGILSLSKDTPIDLKNPNSKTTSSSKLPIAKALLDNVLSDITTKGFSLPVAQSLPLTSLSVLDKTLYQVESPISQITEDSPALPVDKNLPITSLSDHSTDHLSISIEDNLSLPIDKTFSESQSLDIPTELSPIDNLGLDIPNFSMYGKEQNESANPSSENLTDYLSSASPPKGILSLSKDTPSDLKKPDNKTPSSSKLPIAKALLVNVLSDITTKSFSVPVAQSLPVTSPSVLDKTLYQVESPISKITEDIPALPVDKTLPITSLSDHSTDNLPIFIEDNLSLPIDKTFSESQSLDIPTELSSPNDKLGLDKPNISMYDKEQDESANPSLEILTDDLSSAAPLEGILSLSKDTPIDLKNPNSKTTSSSKLPIAKALLENVLSDITTKGFSLPVAQSLPLTSLSVLDKTLYQVESPISQITEDSPALPVDKNLPITSLSDHSTDHLSISIEDNLSLPIDKTFSESQSLDIPTELSPIDNLGLDIPNFSMYGKEQNESANPSSENLTDYLSSASPPKGILSLSKDTPSDLKKTDNKTPSSSKLPIAKALLVNVLSDITTKSFSVPVAQSLPVTSPSVLDKTLYQVESSISQITEDIPALPVDKTLPITSLSDHSTDNLPIFIEDNLSIPIDKTFSESQSLDIPTELSSPNDKLGLDKPNISMLNKEQDESANPSLENLTDHLSSAAPLEGILSLSKDTPIDLKNPNSKTTSSSKLPIAKALLENVLSDITTKGFSLPVAQSLPLTSLSVLDKTLYQVESPISQITEDSPALPVDKNLPITSLFDHLIDNLPISIEDNLSLPIDITFSESQSLDIPTELSSPIDNLGLDIPNISMCDKEQDGSANPSSENLTHDLSSASPMEGIFSLSKDTLSDLKNPNNKIPSSSKLPIAKALLVNVLSDITTKGFSLPVAQSLPLTSLSVLDKTLYQVESPISQITEDSPALPVDKNLPITSLSDHSTDHLSISIEDNLSLPIDKTFSESQSLDIPRVLSSPIDNLGLDIPNTSMYDKEHDESANPSSENLTDDLSSASPKKGILSLSKDTPSDLKSPNNKTPSSSKLPIAKALLENVLSDITTKGFSVPVAQSLPVTSPSELDKTLCHVDSPISQITEDSPTLSADKILPITSLFDHLIDNLPISIEDNLSLPIDITFSESQSLDIPTELSSPIDNLGLDIPNISMCDKEQDGSANPSSENLTHDLSSASPMEGIFSLSKDTLSDLKNPNNKIPSSSKLPIAKALLENVLSDITTKGFSVPVGQSLPVTSPSVLDKTLYQVESPISQITEDSPALPLDKNLPITSLSDHSTDNLSISIEDNLSLPIDKTFSESQSLDIPTELSSPIDNLGLDVPNTSMYDKEQDESANPSSENLTDDLSSASPTKGILSLSKDTPRDLKNPDNKTPSSSKLPIAKALLVNVLSDITTKSFSVPVAQSLPVTSPSVLDKALYQVESPISQITEDITALPVDKTLSMTSKSDHSTDNLPVSIQYNLPLPIDKTFSKSQSLDIPTELSSPIDNLALDIPNTSMYDKEQDESANPSSENLTDDLSSASPTKGILSLSKDTPSDLKNPNNRTPSSSKLPIAKALLENVLSDITTKGFSVPVGQSLPVTSPSVLDKTLYQVESPISQITEDSPALPLDKNLPITSLSDHSTDNLSISIKDNLSLSIDKTFSESQSLDIPTELSSPIDNLGLDIPNTSMYDKEQDESANPSSENLTDDLSSASPTKGYLSLSKDTPSDLKNPNNRTPSSSKLPISKALLENVLSDITTKGFSVPIAKSLLVTSPSVLDKTIYNVESPISHITEDSPALPLPTDKTFSESQNSDITTELSSPVDNVRSDIPKISMYYKEQDERANLSSENLTDNLPSASPLEGILSLSKDTPSDLTLPNNKTPSSSKLPITKALLQIVLSDITKKGFSIPVAQSLPVTSTSVLDKTIFNVESPISHITEDSPALPLPTDKTFSESQNSDITTELSSPVDNVRPDIQNISMYYKEQDESANPSSENITDDVSSASPLEGSLSLSKDTPNDPTLPNNKTPSSSKLPITKALLENVLSDITTKGFSVPIAKSLLVTSPSVLEKTIYNVESPISHITEDSPALPLPTDKTFSESQNSDIPTELSSPVDNVRSEIPKISMYYKEQDESANLSSENLTDDLPSASPLDGILSLSKDTPSDLTLPNNKTPSSSKLPITKALLENVLSDITTKGFSVPVAQSLLDTSPSVLDSTLYNVESPISHITEDSPALLLDKTLPITSLSNHSTDNSPMSVEDNLPLPIDKTFLESQSLDIPRGLSSPIDNLRLDIPNISMFGKEQDDSENSSSKNLRDDPSSASPMEGILSLSKDTLSYLKNPNNKIPSSSKLPITKALLENVLSDITTKGFSVPIPQSLLFTSPSVLDKTLYNVESPISHITEDNPALPIPTDKTFSESQNSDITTELSSPVDNVRPDIQNISMYYKEQDESANPSSENITHDVSSASPLEGSLSLSKDTPNDPTLPNNKTPSSSKLPITKALLENVLSDITTKGFSVPIAKSLLVTSPSVLEKTIYNVESPISHITEDSPALPLPTDKTFSESQNSDIPTELSSPVDNVRSDIPKISMYYKEQDESANLSSENLTDDLPSASPLDGILSLSKDTPSDLTLPNNKTPSSSKLPITKALLENVLSDITTKGFSVPVAQSLLDTSPSVLDRTLYNVESPISHITEDSPALLLDKTLPITSLSDHSTDNSPMSVEDNLPLPIDKTFLESQSLDIPRGLSSPIDNLRLDIPNISMFGKEQDDSENSSSKNLRDDPSSASPMEGILSLSKDTLSYLKNPNNKIPSSSKLPITKALLENVLSDITTKGFSVPIPQSLLFTSPSVLDKTLYTVESPISHITEDSPALPIPTDKTFSESQNSDITTELSSPVDNVRPDIQNISMYYKEQDESANPSSENITDDVSSASPLEGSLSLSKDTPNDLTLPNNKTPSSSKLPITKALLESVLSDITTKGFSVPIAKSLLVTSPSVLEKTIYNVESPISHITEDSPALPLPTDKTFSESQNSDIPTELSSPVDNVRSDIPKISMYYKEQDESANLSSENLTDDLPSASPLDGILSLSKDTPIDLTLPNNKTTSSSKVPITKALLENVLSDITTKGFSVPVAQSLLDTSPSVLDCTLYNVESPISHITEDSPALLLDKTLPITSLSDHSTGNSPMSVEDNLPLPIDKTFLESQSLDIPRGLSSPIDNLRLDIPNISMFGKEQDDSENSSSKNPTDDPSSASPMEGILSLSKDTLSYLKNPNNKIPSSSKLPITKALLENVLSDITTKGFSVPIAQSLLFTSPSVLDKTLYNVESPISHITEGSPALPLPTDKTFSESQSLYIPTELSSPVDNVRPDIPNISMYYKEQDESANLSSENLTDDLPSASPLDGILSLSKDTPSDLTLRNNKTPSSSKLLITKALLENVLSDINTRGFSLPVAQALPRSQLDKTLYFLESPVSDVTEKSSVVPTDNFPSSEINEDVAPRPTDKTLPDNTILGIPTDKLLMDKIHNSYILTDDVGQEDNSEILTDDIENEDKSDKSDNLTDDIEIEDSNESLFSDDATDDEDVPSDLPLPRTKPNLASRIPITKAVLEKVLSGISGGGIHL